MQPILVHKRQGKPSGERSLNVALLLIIMFCAPAIRAQDHRLRVMSPTRQFLRENRVEEAMAVLEQAAEKTDHPDDQAYYLKEASDLARGRLKDVDRAMRLARRITDPARSQSQQLCLLGNEQRWTQITNRFGEVDISAWPRGWRTGPYLARARAFLEGGQTAQAEADLLQVIDGTGNFSLRGRACQMLGDLYRHTMNDPERALAVYRQGVALTEAYYAWRNQCFLGMISIFKEQGRYGEAATAFETIDYRNVGVPYWRIALQMSHADLLRRQGNNGQAATLLTRLLRAGDLSDGARQQVEAELDRLIEKMWEQSGESEK